MVKDIVKKIYRFVFFPILWGNRRFAFSAEWQGIFFNPFYFARKGLFCNIRELGKFLYGDVLDVGCGSKPYKSLIAAHSYVGLEYDTPENRTSKAADFFYDGTVFPFADSQFDCVFCSQVLEHVFNPFEFLPEINRVVKPGGKLLLTVPFVWDEHEQPYDFARYSSFGLRSMLERNGFEIITQRKSCNDVSMIFQLWNDYCYKKIMGQGNALRLLLVYCICTPSTLLGLLLSYILPSNNDLFLDNIVLAVKKEG